MDLKKHSIFLASPGFGGHYYLKNMAALELNDNSTIVVMDTNGNEYNTLCQSLKGDYFVYEDVKNNKLISNKFTVIDYNHSSFHQTAAIANSLEIVWSQLKKLQGHKILILDDLIDLIGDWDISYSLQHIIAEGSKYNVSLVLFTNRLRNIIDLNENELKNVFNFPQIICTKQNMAVSEYLKKALNIDCNLYELDKFEVMFAGIKSLHEEHREVSLFKTKNE